MKATVVKQFDFPAAHSNTRHDGHCRNIHGHTWVLEVHVRGRIKQEAKFSGDPDYGMVIDFQKIKEAYAEMVEPYVEHQFLNETLNPVLEEFTTELIAAWALKQLKKKLPRVCKVRLWEGKTSFVEVTEGDLICT